MAEPEKDLSHLRKILTGYFDTIDSAKTIAQDAGIDPTQIDLEGSVSNAWREIINEACKQKKLNFLIKKAIASHQDYHNLKPYENFSDSELCLSFIEPDPLPKSRFPIQIIIGIITIITPILFFAYEKLYKEEPFLSVEQSHKEIIIKNQSNAEAKIIDSIYIKDDIVFCLNNRNISSHLGTSVFMYKIDTDKISNKYEVGSASFFELITCKKEYCDRLYLDSPLASLMVYIRYKGKGFLNGTNTTCGSNAVCQKHYDSTDSTCKEVDI